MTRREAVLLMPARYSSFRRLKNSEISILIARTQFSERNPIVPNLRDQLAVAISHGRLCDPFSPKDVLALGLTYEKGAINSILANFSIGPGDRKGDSLKNDSRLTPHFKRLAHGTYSIYISPEVDQFSEMKDAEDIDEESNSPLVIRNNFDEIVAKFCDYIKNVPFRYLKKNKGQDAWLPDKPAFGWQQRLDTYYWAGRSWPETQEFLNEINLALAAIHLNENLEEGVLQDIYKRIIDWGNPKGRLRGDVELAGFLERLPIIHEVDSTLTKLYALALPDDFVIYDSRVASAILSIAEYMYPRRTINKRSVDTVESVFQKEFPSLGLYGGTGGTRPRAYRANWPVAYGEISAQLEANSAGKKTCITLSQQ